MSIRGNIVSFHEIKTDHEQAGLCAKEPQGRDFGQGSVRKRIEYKSTNEKVLATLAAMEANLEEPLSRATLARRKQVSVRQLERLFRSNLRQTIGKTYMRIRLTRAAILLKESSIPLVDFALASGFASASHFSRAFKSWHGPPRALRNAKVIES